MDRVPDHRGQASVSGPDDPSVTTHPVATRPVATRPVATRPTGTRPAGSGDVGADVTDLAERLRTEGVVVVASRAVAASRPEGIDLLGALPVLAREVAEEWQDAADSLPVLHQDRLQLRSAAALLRHGAASAEADAVQAEALDVAAVARAVTLRSRLAVPTGEARESGESAWSTGSGGPEPADGAGPGDDPAEEANLVLDRTWAVLCDLRRLAGDSSDPDDPAPGGARNTGIVPSAAHAGSETWQPLGPALHRAACAGALVGLLAPWLPPPRHDALACVDALLEAVSDMARRHHDHTWWATLVTMGRVAASLSVAASHAAARYSGRRSDAAALVLSEPALSRIADQALSLAAALAGDGHPGSETGTPARGAMGFADGARAASAMPQASPSQQARAAAERAAAERHATQQAFVERANATRAARAAAAAGPATQPVSLPAQPDVQSRDVQSRETQARDEQVRDEQAHQVEAVDLETGEITLGVWDTLMRPR